MRARTVVFSLVGIWMAQSVSAGTVLSTGMTPLFGMSTSYREWLVFNDPVGPGQSGSTGTQTDVRSMAFYGGELYIGSSSTLGAVGPVRYVPGASGSLASPTSLNFPFSFPGDRALMGRNTRRLAINGSGSGFGAFASGASPTLVGISLASQEPFNPGDVYFALGQGPNTAGASIVPGAAGAQFRPSAFGHSRVLNQYITAGAGTNPALWDQFTGGSSSAIRFHAHSGSGIDFQNSVSSFSVDVSSALFVRGIAPISGSFASTLLGVSVSDPEVLLTLVRYEDGRGTPNELRVYGLTGARLGTSPIALAALNDPFGLGSKPVSLAVDEANGQIFVGEQLQGRVFAFAVPTPGAGLVMGLGWAVCARRRRFR